MRAGREPIVTQRGIYCSPNQDMYFKGALFLHTLRGVVNDDEKWFELGRQSDFLRQPAPPSSPGRLCPA